ncbi:MAG TPA: RluA family pseudouridine synthase [Tepidisphaeraceae bacterium]|nr:RluA family pseudouridine synthase [Tepidisphaeraceae bacterium]
MTAKADLDVLWENADYVAVLKPAGLATIPGRAEDDSVLERLGRQLGLPSSGSADPRVRVVHRLDKETSGVLLFAKNSAAQRHVSSQFQKNLVEKEYLAVIAGRPATDQREIDAPLSRHPTNPVKMSVAKHGGRPARTLWKTEESFRLYTLLRVFPKTGKTHQIRVHLKHIGLPLAIDPLYNPGGPGKILLSSFKRGYRPGSDATERPLIERLTLHAHRLTFRDRGEQVVQLEASPPKDLRSLLNMLRKYGR